MLTSLHVIGSKTFGGAERFYLRLIAGLKERGESVMALVRRDGPVAPHVPAGIPLHTVPMRTVWDPLSRWQVSHTVRALKPDIVQTYMGRATRLTHIKGSGIVHVARLGGFYKLDGYRHANAWIGNTHAICDYLRAGGFPAERVFHIPNFVEPVTPPVPEHLMALRARLGIPADAYVVVGVGRLIAKKGFDDLIAAFAHVPPTLHDRPTHLVIVGAGEQLPQLQTQARQLSVAGRVHWAGWQDDPAPFYALADVFVCPSLHEPLGNVILEAWAHGVAVVSTDTHGARELIEDHVNGVLAPCANPTQLTQRIQQVLRDESARADLGAAGARKLGVEFSRAAVVTRYIELYRQLRRA